jgi:hypothetical protein
MMKIKSHLPPLIKGGQVGFYNTGFVLQNY